MNPVWNLVIRKKSVIVLNRTYMILTSQVVKDDLLQVISVHVFQTACTCKCKPVVVFMEQIRMFYSMTDVTNITVWTDLPPD